ncbi:MAG: cysteine desulfuration protein SufE [Verrucomicrobiales bacterium]|jgi:cysteine desulfuration protein SufE
MTLAEKQKQWIEDYGLIENAHERLTALVDRSRRMAPLDESLRTEDRRVTGCVSAVWVHGTIEDENCHFHMASDSAMVGGLVGLLCSLYSGHPPGEVAATEPSILEALQLARQISPTRMNGLAHVRQVIKAFAERHA